LYLRWISWIITYLNYFIICNIHIISQNNKSFLSHPLGIFLWSGIIKNFILVNSSDIKRADVKWYILGIDRNSSNFVDKTDDHVKGICYKIALFEEKNCFRNREETLLKSVIKLHFLCTKMFIVMDIINTFFFPFRAAARQKAAVLRAFRLSWLELKNEVTIVTP